MCCLKIHNIMYAFGEVKFTERGSKNVIHQSRPFLCNYLGMISQSYVSKPESLLAEFGVMNYWI